MSIWDVLLQQVINGVSLGAMYALLALGFTMVYGIIELINFAHFNIFMVGSFFAMWVLKLLGQVSSALIQNRSPSAQSWFLIKVREPKATTTIASAVTDSRKTSVRIWCVTYPATR